MCPECADGGFVRRAAPPGHPDFGRAFPCGCAENEAQDDQQARLQRYSNLGRLATVTFASLEAMRSKAFADAWARAKEYAGNPDGWLVFYGKSGSGKTSLGAAIANERIAQGLPALYVIAPDLLDHLRAAYSADADLPYPRLFEQVRNAPFLIIDDLDAQNPTAWAQEKFFQILNYRANEGLPTVILLSRAPAAFQPHFSFPLQGADHIHISCLDSQERGAYRQIGGMTRERLESCTFAAFNPHGRGNLSATEVGSVQHVFDMARTYARHGRGWLTLWGKTGRGKTHLAAAIAVERLAAGDDVYLAVVPDLLDHLRSTYSPNNPEGYDEVFEAVRTAGLLILDDLGAHSTTPWAEEKLYQIFSFRYINALPTVITTNVDLNDLDDRTRLPERIFSRMIDITLGAIAQVDAPDYRAGQASRQVDERPDRRGRYGNPRRR